MRLQSKPKAEAVNPQEINISLPQVLEVVSNTAAPEKCQQSTFIEYWAQILQHIDE